MTLIKRYLLAVLILLAILAVMHAQSGCSDSPEAATDVLMLVGSVGMMYGSSVMMKVIRKIKK